MEQNQAVTSNTTPSFQIPKAYLRYVRLLEFISFRLAAKEIRARFFTPIPFKTPDREKPFLNEAREEELMVSDRPITVHTLGNGDKTAVFIHGWSGRGSQAYAMAPSLVEAGFKLITITAQAHGNNPGKRTHMLQFTDAILETAKLTGKIHALIAHSLGGAAAFNAVDQGLDVDKLVILGAPSSIKTVITDFCERLHLDDRYSEYLQQYLRDNYNPDIEALAPRELSKKMSIPGLIVHDKQDIDVHFEQAEALNRNWKNSDLVLTEGLGHRRILSDEAVIQRIVDFVK